MTPTFAAGAVFLAATLQSATGFGFALVSAPVLFAVLGPQEAVSAGALLGIALSTLTLATERRIPAVLRGEAVALVLWAVPGLAIGAIALRELPDDALSAIVACGVLGGLAVRLRARAPAAERATPRRAHRSHVEAHPGGMLPPRPWRAAAAGASSGALSTSTSLSGPPLVLHLLARGVSPAQLRDTLAAIFVALSLMTTATLLIAGTFTPPPGLVGLMVAAVAGQLLGRRGFARLHGDRHENAVLAVLAGAALVALVASVS